MPQSIPVYPFVQAHVLGPTQVPPFLQDGVHVAKKSQNSQTNWTKNWYILIVKSKKNNEMQKVPSTHHFKQKKQISLAPAKIQTHTNTNPYTNQHSTNIYTHVQKTLRSHTHGKHKIWTCTCLDTTETTHIWAYHGDTRSLCSQPDNCTRLDWYRYHHHDRVDDR